MLRTGSYPVVSNDTHFQHSQPQGRRQFRILIPRYTLPPTCSPFPFFPRVPSPTPPHSGITAPSLCETRNHSLIKIFLTTICFNGLAFELDNLAFPSVVPDRLQSHIFGIEKLNIECLFVFTFNLFQANFIWLNWGTGTSHKTTKGKKKSNFTLVVSHYWIATLRMSLLAKCFVYNYFCIFRLNQCSYLSTIRLFIYPFLPYLQNGICWGRVY